MDDYLGGGNYGPTEQQKNAKKWMKIIGVILVLLFLIVIALIAVIYYIQSTQLKISLDDVSTPKLENVLIFENGKVYIPIRDFASYVGYQSFSGDYKQYAEDTTKCYVQNENEVASFSLNSDKIYKILLDGNNDYEYYEIDEPVKMINNKLCTTIEGAKTAFNISMGYNLENNKVTIYTLPHLVKYYTNKFQNAGIADRDANFSNQKALLFNRLIVKNQNNNYGVIDLSGKEILGTKYASIKFIESTKEFIVKTLEGKMGIMSYDAVTKVSPEYDSIKQIDKDNGLYLATNNKKQGVINNNGEIIIFLEYDQIGIDGTKYKSNNIKNQYLLYEKVIPVKRNNVWNLFDKTGKQITTSEKENFDFEELGCNDISNSKNANTILLVPQYEGIIVKKGGLYGLVDSNGDTLLPIVLKSIYSVTAGGEETYQMVYGEQIINVIDYIKTYVKPTSPITENQNNNVNTNNTNTNVNNVNSNNANTNVNYNNSNANSTSTNINNANSAITNTTITNVTTTNALPANSTTNNIVNNTTTSNTGTNIVN